MNDHDDINQPDDFSVEFPLSPDVDDDPPQHPILRRMARIIYIVIVILVIVGLILMIFPWRPEIPFPRELPWKPQTLRIMIDRALLII